MGDIHLLDDIAINKIAAGEVVDRPSSVVKELLENAIDAGATEIILELDEGGTRNIVITDNGKGMDREDALLSVRRHATSKITAAEDIFSVNTFGFRGEALASIASVSKLSIATRRRGASAGTKVFLDGGAEPLITDWQGSDGTTVSVTDLFYNIPARSAFLKSSTTEFSHCVDWVEQTAFINPSVGVTLMHNGKERMRVPVSTGYESLSIMGESVMRSRARTAFGAEFDEGMIYVRKENQYGEVEGLIAPPGLTTGSHKAVFTFVNGRPVKDRQVKMGIIRGYHGHLMHGQNPRAIINLRANPSLVDINVHPAKTEIRLQYASEFQALIATAVREGIRSGEWASAEANASPSTPASSYSSSGAPTHTHTHSFAPRSSSNPMNLRSSTPSFSRTFAGGNDFVLTPTSMPVFTPTEATNTLPTEVIPWTELDYVGTAFACYLMFQHDGRMLVIDQHAFHERILYERFISDKSLMTRSQPLLMPEALELDPQDYARVREIIAPLNKLGFALSDIGEGTIEVAAVPMLIARRDVRSVILELLQFEGQAGLDSEDVASLQHVAATMACHSAVRAGEDLSQSELKILLGEAATVDFYLNCPHGRRVFRWWNESQVASWFDR